MDLWDRDLSGKTKRPLLGKLDHARPAPVPAIGPFYCDGHDFGKIGVSSFGLSNDHHKDTDGDGQTVSSFFDHVGMDAFGEKEVRQDGLVIPINRESFQGKGTEKGEIVGEGPPNPY